MSDPRDIYSCPFAGCTKPITHQVEYPSGQTMAARCEDHIELAVKVLGDGVSGHRVVKLR